MQTPFFKNLRVIELSNVLAGPLVGTFFAELGAKVIKIENKSTGGDITRTWKTPKEKKGNISAYYASANGGKKTLMLDLGSAKDKHTVIDLIKNADILISNYKAGDAKKLGMDHASLKKINPSIIYGHISGFGSDNKRIAYDLVLQAETGFMSMNGTEESGPLKMPVALIDVLAAHQMKEAILIALINRLKTGKGASLSVSLYDTAIASLANQASNWLMTRLLPKRTGSLHPNIAPYGETFLCRDKKHIVLAIGNDKQFKLLCGALKADKIQKDERYNNNTQRVKYRKELAKNLDEYFNVISSKKLMNIFINNNIPAALIQTIPEALSSKASQRLIIKEKTPEGYITLRVKTIAFQNRVIL